MVLLVPFDGSDLSETALARATRFADLTDEEVVALTVLPDDPSFARERGWVNDGEPYEPERVAERFRGRVRDLAPDATFRFERPDDVELVASTEMDISRKIRQVAHEVDASIVFIGSENAGRVTRPVTSVGTPVSEDPAYDVHIVRHAD